MICEQCGLEFEPFEEEIPETKCDECVARERFEGTRFSESAMAATEEKLKALGVEFGRLGWDDYDNSIEIYDVPPDVRLSDEVQEYLGKECGFSIIFVNHTDKWETHYSAWKFPTKGWRVSYPHKRGPNEQGILVEEAVKTWPKEWFETGYAKVVKCVRELEERLKKDV